MSKTYLVNIPFVEHNGTQIYICGQIDADNWADAEKIADYHGYDLLGELEDTIECAEEVEAMIQKQYETLQ